MVEQHTFHIFDKVKVTISLDNSNIQHQKIRMALTDPVVRTDQSEHGFFCITLLPPFYIFKIILDFSFLWSVISI